MPAVNKAFACLVFRFTVTAVSDPNKPWDFFPFDNERFCQTASIRSTDVGLSEPPVGTVGASLSEAVLAEWPNRVQRALDWIARCDAHIASLGSKKPKGWESLQKNVLNIVAGRESWEWLVSHCFGAPNGLYDKLKELMRDHRCDGYSAYERAREDQMARQRDQFREWQVADITKLDNYWPSAQEGLTRALCGDVLGSGRPPVSWYPTIRALVARIFEPTARSLSQRVRKLKSLEEDLELALEAATENPTKESLRKVTASYSKLLTKQRSLGIQGQAEEIGPWRAKVNDLMKSLGREIKGGQTIRGKGAHPKARLVPEADLDAAWVSYQEALWISPIGPRAAEQHNDPADGDEFTDVPSLALNTFPQDVGVEKWRKLSVEDIEKALGIPDSGLPGSVLGPDGKPALKFSWSQWVAILELVDRSFTRDGQAGTPALLADEVGFGKTGQVIGFLQTLWHLKIMQDSNPAWPDTDGSEVAMKWPPILADRKSFMGRGRIPNLPSIIVVPPTLVAQWNAELRAWLSPTACHILEFRGNSSERELFFSKGREYDLAMGRKHKERTIILAEAPSVINESKNVLFVPGDRATATPNTGPAHLVAKSLYGREYLFGVVEESHAYRSWGDNFRAMLSLMDKCCQRASVTATPLFNHPRNLLLQGRLLRALKFIGSNGASLTKMVEGQFKLHNKAWDSDPEEQKSLRRFLTSLYSTTDAGAAGADAHLTLIDHLLSQQGQSLASYRAFWSAREGMFTLRDELRDIIIRRDKRSVDNRGQNLLPPVSKVDSISYFALDEATDHAIASKTATKKARSDCRVDISGWLIDIKKALIHPILIAERDDNCTFKEWMMAQFPTREAYQANPSAKLNRLLFCVKHHLGIENKDALPLFWNRDGTLKSEPSLGPTVTTRPATRRRKIVIFCNVSESWTLASHVLNLHGYPTLHINGVMTLAARDKAVQEFQSEDGHDILFISDVGAQGLNLQRGSIVIFLDHPWSASEEQQVKGRVDRRGQEEDVYSYRLTCPDSVDELVQEYASGKRLMFQVYTGECAIRGVTAGKDNGLESEDEDQAPPANPRSKTLLPPSSKQGKSNSPSQPLLEPQQQDPSSSSPTKRKRPSRAKQPDPDFPSLGIPPRAGSKKRKEYDEKLAALRRVQDEKLAELRRARDEGSSSEAERSSDGSKTHTDIEMDNIPPEESTGFQPQYVNARSSPVPVPEDALSEDIVALTKSDPNHVIPVSSEFSDTDTPELDQNQAMQPNSSLRFVHHSHPRARTRAIHMRSPPKGMQDEWRLQRDTYAHRVREGHLSSKLAQRQMKRRGLPPIPERYFQEAQQLSDSFDGSLEDYGSSPSQCRPEKRKRLSDSPELVEPHESSGESNGKSSDGKSGSELNADQTGLIDLVSDGRLCLEQAQTILHDSGQKLIPLTRMPIPPSSASIKVTRLPSKFPRRSKGSNRSLHVQSTGPQATSTPHRSFNAASQHIPQNASQPVKSSSSEASETSSETSSESPSEDDH